MWRAPAEGSKRSGGRGTKVVGGGARNPLNSFMSTSTPTSWGVRRRTELNAHQSVKSVHREQISSVEVRESDDHKYLLPKERGQLSAWEVDSKELALQYLTRCTTALVSESTRKTR